MITIEDGRSDLAKLDSGTLSKPSRSLTVGQLEIALMKRYPPEDAEPWDRTGLLVGDPAALVEGVAIALDPTTSAIDAAAAAGANVLLTHHPAFLSAPPSITPSLQVSGCSGASVYAAVSKGIALVNFHTALDASLEATRMFPRMLNLNFERLLSPLATDKDKGYAISCSPGADDAPFKLAHLAARVTSVFGKPPRVWGNFDAVLHDIVIGNGSANAIVGDCVEAHVDCLVCGEVKYHLALEAFEAGLAIVELGHDVSELPLCGLLAKACVDAGVPQDDITMIDQSRNWSYPDPRRV